MDWLIRIGEKYRHFKGKEDEIVCMARHSETEELMVVYKALYGPGETWVRPAKMFFEQIEVNGEMVYRFKKINFLKLEI